MKKDLDVLNAEEESLDTSDGVKWYALCRVHGWLQPFRRKEDAEYAIRCNRHAVWCEYCSEFYQRIGDTENFEEVKWA